MKKKEMVEKFILMTLFIIILNVFYSENGFAFSELQNDDTNNQSTTSESNYIDQYSQSNGSSFADAREYTYTEATYFPDQKLIKDPCIEVYGSTYAATFKVVKWYPFTVDLIYAEKSPAWTACGIYVSYADVVRIGSVAFNGNVYFLELAPTSTPNRYVSTSNTKVVGYYKEGSCYCGCKSTASCAISCDGAVQSGSITLSASGYFPSVGPTSWNYCAWKMHDWGMPGW